MVIAQNFLILTCFLVIGIAVCQVGGALIYVLFARSMGLSRFGPFFSFILGSPLHLIGIVKLFTWLVSSSGLIAGYWTYALFLGVPETRPEYWAMFAVAAFSLARITNYLVMFDLLSFRKAFHISSKMVTPKALRHTDEKKQHKLAVQNFIAFYLTQFFRLLVSCGVVYYSIGKLGLVTVIEQPTLFESIGMAFSLIDLTEAGAKSYAGPVWVSVRALSAFLVFYWTVLFISLAASTINPDDFNPNNLDQLE